MNHDLSSYLLSFRKALIALAVAGAALSAFGPAVAHADYYWHHRHWHHRHAYWDRHHHHYYYRYY